MQKANTIPLNKNLPKKPFLSEEVQGASRLVSILLLAWKNFTLYPEGHVNSTKAIANLESAFNDFFSTHSDLRLTVERNRLLWDTTVLHEVSSDSPSEDIIFLLYRDGIQWLEFQQGIPLEELASFFKIMNKYRALIEETEGDIVTSLFDEDLEHIKFKAVDIFWQDVPLLDFSSLDTSLPGTEEVASQIDTDETQQPKEQARSDLYSKSIADPSISDELWEISPAEHEKLQKMVLEEENWDNTEDVFDVLLVILRSQTDRYNFSSVLDFTLEEVVETIEQGEFRLLLNLFQSLHQMLYNNASADPVWNRPLITRFFQDLSNPEIFDLITSRLMMLNDGDTEKIQALRQVLLYFSPAIIVSLGPFIMKSQSPAVEKMIMGVIEYLCLRDMGPLETILDNSDTELGEKLLPLLSGLKGDRTTKIFFKMTEHPSEKVRSEAVRVLLSRDPQFVLKLFSFINAPDKEIRRDILAGIAKQKSSVLENMLLQYIKENADNKDHEHILACYEALGHCSSDTATPFLKRILLDKGWNQYKGFGKLIHREGAATALTLLDTWEAKDILLAASKSKFKVIREAFLRAMTKSETSEEKNNG